MIIKNKPVVWSDSGALDLSKYNDLKKWAESENDELAKSKYVRSVVTLPLVGGSGAPYTGATDSNLLTFKFRAPNDFVLENTMLEMVLGSGSWDLEIDLLDSVGTKIKTLVADSGDETTTTIVANDPVSLDANTEYQIGLSGTFTFTQAFLVLHLRGERSAPFYYEKSSLKGRANLSAPEVIQVENNINARSATLPAGEWPRCEVFSSTDITGSAKHFRSPVSNTKKLRQILVYGYSSSGGTLEMQTINSSSGTRNTTLVLGAGDHSRGIQSFSVDLTGDPLDPADDIQIQLYSSTGTVDAAYVYLFYV